MNQKHPQRFELEIASWRCLKQNVNIKPQKEFSVAEEFRYEPLWAHISSTFESRHRQGTKAQEPCMAEFPQDPWQRTSRYKCCWNRSQWSSPESEETRHKSLHPIRPVFWRLVFCPFGPRRACNHPIPAASRCCCMGGTNPYQSKEQTSKHLNIASTAHVVMDVDAFCILLMQIDAEAVLLGMNEDVLELQVSMNNLMSMHVLNTICKLLEDVLCLQKLCSTYLQFNKKTGDTSAKNNQRYEDADCFWYITF